jgi:ATP-dependent RNA helicase DDX52/ROK1
VRRAGLEKEGGKGGKAKISTKSGYERKVENRKKGAVMGSRRRAEREEQENEAGSDGGSEFGGFDD